LVFVYGFCNGNRSAAVEGNIGSNIHITWSYITQHLQMCTEALGRRVPALELIGNTFNRGMMPMFLM
jgi:hypothetical protein